MNKRASQRVVGQTKDVGFQIGVRRTYAVSPQQAWSRLTSPDGLALWLGDVADLRFEPGTSYRTGEGVEGTIRIVKPGSHARLGWRPRDWHNESTLQVRVLPSPSSGKTAVGFHQEKLLDTQQRRQMHRHWLHVLDQLEGLLQGED